MLSED